ncbi:MAG: putative porin [Proteobacteria bacterium]|nr:putative porin [Pseudomonadota bacterium]
MIRTSNFTKAIRIVVLAATLALTLPVLAANDALMELVKILRDKGSLTQDEYELLVRAAKADEEKIERVKHEVAEEIGENDAVLEDKTEEPSWSEKIEFKGDLRTRYQYEDEDGRDERGRGRLRYRLGVIAKPSVKLEVGAGLASGSGDQRSTNQSFDATFSTKAVNLDYAYMQYAFENGLTAIAGKFKRANFLWAPTDVMWDSDINPEGLSANYRGMNTWGGYFANAGVWVLEENAGSSDDPFMGYGQIGQSWTSGEWFGTLSGAVYGFGDVTFVSDFTSSAGTNTDSKLSSFNLAGELGIRFGGGKVRLVGEYINNFETNTSADTAWALGAKYAWNKWRMKYIYADLEANSVPDFLPDSDRFNGLTGIRGHEFEINFALVKHVSIGLNFYHVEAIATDIGQDLLQVDMNVEF